MFCWQGTNFKPICIETRHSIKITFTFSNVEWSALIESCYEALREKSIVEKN